MHPGRVELIGHHASLPLALAILYQDYPFAFADLFLKRVLTLLAVVAIVFTAMVLLGHYSAPFADVRPRQPASSRDCWSRYGWRRRCCTRWFDDGTTWFVDTIVLRRADYATLRTEITRHIQTQQDVPTLLSDVCQMLQPALSARDVTWDERDRDRRTTRWHGDRRRRATCDRAGRHERTAVVPDSRRRPHARPAISVRRCRGARCGRRCRGPAHRRHSNHARAI